MAEKLSPQDKAPRTDNPDDSDNLDIEITEIIPSKDASNVRTKDKRLDHFNKVLGIIEDLTPIVDSNEPVTKANFRKVLFMVTTLCQLMFDEYGIKDRILNENSQIRNVNQDQRFNDHVMLTRNDMEKSQSPCFWH